MPFPNFHLNLQNLFTKPWTYFHDESNTDTPDCNHILLDFQIRSTNEDQNSEIKQL